MSLDKIFGNYFKAEVKSAGRKLATQGKVTLSTKSETGVQAYVKATPPVKVTLSAKEISSSSFSANCNCPIAKKNRLCKHIWATLLQIEESYPDFLVGKHEINTPDAFTLAQDPVEPNAYQETQKQRASDYRKEQYQKQKERLNTQKQEKKKTSGKFSQKKYSEEVENALSYFAKNGFPMAAGPDEVILIDAKRKLSRLFHPDKGGTHEESVELNTHCDSLQKFIQS